MTDHHPGPPLAWMSWSSGKDSARALHEVRTAGSVEVVGLLTTVNSTADRVAMHGVRRALLEAQAAAVGLPLQVVELPWPCPDGIYEERMTAALDQGRQVGIGAVVFGDLYLEDVRAYREQALEGTGVMPVFPLWGRPTDELAGELLSLGFRAIVTCVDLAQAPGELAGRWYDEALLADLPAGADPCGENGEFHTVVVDGPGFSHPIEVERGVVVEREGFVFADVIPVGATTTGTAASTPRQ
jgi:uncharacterized protein (TIGR00290 family)